MATAARGLGQGHVAGEVWASLTDRWVHFLAPIVGGILAAGVCGRFLSEADAPEPE